MDRPRQEFLRPLFKGEKQAGKSRGIYVLLMQIILSLCIFAALFLAGEGAAGRTLPFLFAGIVLLFLVLTYFKFLLPLKLTLQSTVSQDEKDKLRELQESRRKLAEIMALQNQINPHFLYNVLDSIRGQAIVKKVPEIADMTEALSKLFRYSISNSSSLVSLGKELKNLQVYFKIQQYRFNNRFRLIIETEEEAAVQLQVPKMTIQPLVENAIYHGLEMKVGHGSIRVRIDRTERDLILHIVDDGVGINPEMLDTLNQKLESQKEIIPSGDIHEKSGIALLNVNQRLKMRYGENYGLHIYSTIGVGTDVEIRLPAVPVP